MRCSLNFNKHALCSNLQHVSLVNLPKTTTIQPFKYGLGSNLVFFLLKQCCHIFLIGRLQNVWLRYQYEHR